MARIVILAAGVMGSAMAFPAAANGHDVTLVGTHLDADIIESIRGNGHHPRLDIAMPAGVAARHWTDFKPAMAAGADLVIVGVSSAGIGWAIERLVEALTGPVPILLITKGVHADGRALTAFPALVAEALVARRELRCPVMAVGGPCIAGELAAGRDTGVVLTGGDAQAQARAAGLLAAPFYHPRLSDDMMGVEICAAFKNFFAIGVGTAAGRLEREGRGSNGALMNNPAASLFNQSVHEMALLVQALGGEPATAHGLAGIGDLYVTCQAGRNARMGRWLGLGLSYTEAKGTHMAADTVEGAELALATGPTLRAMMADGRLDAGQLPLSRAILATILDGQPFAVDWQHLHR
jgi:glycerol-3-phosphate dehydrogenase (NAD(P)+)